MKIFLIQSSLLGGFYWVVSSLLELFKNDVLSAVNEFSYLALIIWIIVLFFRKPIAFLEGFRKKFSEISICLIAVGWTVYLNFPLLIWAFFEGYRKEMAAYNNVELETIPMEEVLDWFGLIHVVSLFVSLLVATIIILYKAYRQKYPLTKF